MSMKMFFLSSLGLIKSTTKIEEEYQRLSAAYQEFTTVAQSEDLKQLRELEKFLASENFIRTKKEIEALRFKGSKEEALLLEYKKLERNKNLRLYYQTEKSADLQRFLKLDSSETVKRFLALEKYMREGSYKSEKKHPEAQAKASEYNQLKQSGDIVFWKKFSKSKALRIFRQMKDSSERKRYEELQQTIGSEEFSKRKAYLEDAKKWEKTEEFKKQQQFESLKKQAPIVRYFEYEKNHQLDFFEKWQLVFQDEFQTGKLNTEKWQTILPQAKSSVGRNYSQAGDLHAYTSGENIKINGKTLCIETRKQKTSGLQWQLPFGFIEKEFDYSTGCINTSESFRCSEAIWEAKIKFAPQKGIVNLFYLSNESNQPIIRIFESGVHHQQGITALENGQMSEQNNSFSGLKTGEFYIFTLQREGNQLIWKINQREMLRLNTHALSNDLYLNASSIVIDETTSTNHSFEIDWVRVFQKK